METGPRTDEELILEVQHGSQECFKELYERFKTRIYNFIYHMIPNVTATEDCVQEVFMHVYEKAKLYTPQAKFSSWVYRIAKNVAIDALRRGKVRKALSLQQPVGDVFSGKDMVELGDRVASAVKGPDKIVESEDMLRYLRWGISQLKEEDRQTIILCDLEGLPYKEVGEILEITPDAVAVRLFRARRKLAQILGIEGRIEG